MNGTGGAGGMFGAKMAILALLGILVFLPACGSGGGGGVDVTPPNTNLNFVFGPPRATVGPLTVTGSQSRFILSATTDGPWMTGTFDTATLDATIADNTAVPILWPDTTTPTGAPLFGNLSVAVSRTFRWHDADDPVEGELLITSRDSTFPGRIRVGVSVQAGARGMLSEYDDNSDGTYEPGVFHPWADFYALWGDGAAPLYQRISSFVYSMRQGVFSLIDLSMQTVNVVEDGRTALEAAGSGKAIRVGCDALPGAPDQPGYYDIVWTDVNGNGVIDADLSGGNRNDTVTVTLQQCWIDDPSDPEDLLLDGVLRLEYYEPHVQWGAVFDELVMTRTLNNVVVPGSAKTVNGGFSLLIPGY